MFKVIEKNELYNSFKTLHLCSGQFKKKKYISKLNKIIGYKNEVERLIKISNLIKTSKNDSLNIDFLDLQKNKNYYKGIKFTFFAKDVRGEIAGGGRYNLKYGSNSETAIGYTCNMDTI